MARKVDQKDIRKLDEAIEKIPGRKSGYWARKFGWSRQKTTRYLTSLNDQGQFYYEDECGGLFPFKRNQ